MSANSSRGPAGFILLMVLLTLVFATLSVWQFQRLGWKEELIAQIEARQDLPPVELPSVDAWSGLAPDDLSFTPVSLTGAYLDVAPIQVFVNLPDPVGERGGPGHWIIAPFQTGEGIVLINRGFVPQDAAYQDTPAGPQALTGLIRRPERTGMFTPEPDVAGRVDWIVDPARISENWLEHAAPVAPFYVDLPAGVPGALPQGGETALALSNNHLSYALTWLAFALMTPMLTLVWLRRRHRDDA